MKWLRDNASVLALLAGMTGALASLYVRAALAETDKRLALQEQAFSAHVKTAQEDKDARRLILQKLDALCRATPQANCPLGTE